VKTPMVPMLGAVMVTMAIVDRTSLRSTRDTMLSIIIAATSALPILLKREIPRFLHSYLLYDRPAMPAFK